MRRERAAAGVLAIASAMAWSGAARAYCPSYGTAAGCAVEPALGDNPDDATFRALFDRVGTVTIAPGEAPAIGSMTHGCGLPVAEAKAPPSFPCHVLYAVAQQESGWTQFCLPEAPQSAVGKPERTIVSFDCGYGVAQVTTGMHDSDTPSFDQGRVASDVFYNMMVGAGILRSKWEAVECVGDRNPEIVEDWYSALWAYNGLSYKNNPNNPTYAAGRGPYDPQNGGSYPYQERIYGWMEFPSPKTQRWKSILPAYPNRGEIGSGSSPRQLSEPSCASPTSCTRKRTTNRSPCTPPPAVVVDAGPPAPPPPPPEVDAGPAVVEEAVEGEADAGCTCEQTKTRARDLPLAFGLLVAVTAFVRRRR